MDEVVGLHGRINQVKGLLRTEISDRQEADNAELSGRLSSVQDVLRRIEGLAGDVLWISAIGVGLLVSGQVVTAIWG